MKIKTLPLTLALLCSFTMPVSATDISGQMIAFSCNGCHGTEGQFATQSFPQLTSQTEETLLQSLLDFKSGRKGASIMQRIAKGYTDIELKAVAHYFSHLGNINHGE